MLLSGKRAGLLERRSVLMRAGPIRVPVCSRRALFSPRSESVLAKPRCRQGLRSVMDDPPPAVKLPEPSAVCCAQRGHL